jgi:hypothetical protein
MGYLLLTEKPRPDGLALAFQKCKPGQSRHEAVKKARLGPAYLGSAWPGSRPQAGPCTALVANFSNISNLWTASALLGFTYGSLAGLIPAVSV